MLNDRLTSNIKHPTSKKGFTLVELLVVIVIISILATLLMANFIGARQRARDAVRKSDVKQIQAALEIYRADNGSYPSSLPCGGVFSSGSATYMKKVPCDPLNTTTSYVYSADATGSTYTITACLENGNDVDRDSSLVAPCTASSYTQQNP